MEWRDIELLCVFQKSGVWEMRNSRQLKESRNSSWGEMTIHARLSFQFTQSYFFLFLLPSIAIADTRRRKKERNKIPKWIKIYFIFCTLLSRTIVNYYHDILHYFFSFSYIATVIIILCMMMMTGYCTL